MGSGCPFLVESALGVVNDMSSGESYTIGKVVKKLSASYPDLTVSKVRYLEAEGLVTPTRTKSGYRTYTDRDVERLELVLRMQKSCFYPLAVIKEKLESASCEELVQELDSSDTASSAVASYDGSYPLERVPELINVPVSFVRTLHESGFLLLATGGSGRSLVNGRDFPLIRAAYELKRYGIDPRFLRAHIQRANREVPLFKQVLTSVVGRQGTLEDARSVQVFDGTLERLLSLSNIVSDSLLRRSLRAEFGHPDSKR